MLEYTEDYLKQRIYLRGWLYGKGYFKAIEAMEFALIHHNGKRKDGQEEFSHQVSQACFAITLVDSMLYPEETFCTIFLHDISEDKDIEIKDIIERYGEIVGKSVRLMSKVLPNQPKIPNDLYYYHLAQDPIASICKGFDRLHNLMSMLNAFKPVKQVEYLTETLDYVTVMLKTARKLFPQQHNIYQNIKYILINQIQLYRALNKEIITNSDEVVQKPTPILEPQTENIVVTEPIIKNEFKEYEGFLSHIFENMQQITYNGVTYYHKNNVLLLKHEKSGNMLCNKDQFIGINTNLLKSLLDYEISKLYKDFVFISNCEFATFEEFDIKNII